jgi:hypothetical protein
MATLKFTYFLIIGIKFFFKTIEVLVQLAVYLFRNFTELYVFIMYPVINLSYNNRFLSQPFQLIIH